MNEQNKRRETVEDSKRDLALRSNSDKLQSPVGNIEAMLGLLKGSISDPLQALTSSDVETQVLALQALGELGEQAPIDKIEKYLEDSPYEAVRVEAIKALGKLRNAGLVPEAPFRTALGDDSQHVRVKAVQVLSSLKPEKISASMIATFETLVRKKNEDRALLLAIVQLYGRLGKRAPEQTLAEMLRHRNWQIREAAALSIGELIKDGSSLEDKRINALVEDLLNALYAEEDSIVREAAIIALGDRLSIRDLIKKLVSGESSVTVKVNVARILGELGDQDKLREKRLEQKVLEVLERMMRDAKIAYELRRAAAFAMISVGKDVEEVMQLYRGEDM